MARNSVWIICLLLILPVAAIAQELIQYQEGDVVLKGNLFRPTKVDGKRAGVVVIPEWWGINEYSRGRASQLSDLGYIAFAADMYGNAHSTTEVEKAKEWSGPFYADPVLMVKRVQAAVASLKKQAGVDPKRIVVLGYCFGGTASLQYASSGAEVAGVVSFHGGLKVSAPSPETPIKAKILILNGIDDPLVPAEERHAFEAMLQKAKVDFTFVNYSGALHAFTNPNASKLGIPGIAYSDHADRRSWALMKSFLKEVLGKQEN